MLGKRTSREETQGFDLCRNQKRFVLSNIIFRTNKQHFYFFKVGVTIQIPPTCGIPLLRKFRKFLRIALIQCKSSSQTILLLRNGLGCTSKPSSKHGDPPRLLQIIMSAQLQSKLRSQTQATFHNIIELMNWFMNAPLKSRIEPPDILSQCYLRLNLNSRQLNTTHQLSDVMWHHM